MNGPKIMSFFLSAYIWAVAETESLAPSNESVLYCNQANRFLAVSATLRHRATQPGERKQLFRHIVIVYQQQLQPLLSLWIWVCEHIRCYLRCSPPLQHRGSSWDGRGFRVSSGWKEFARHHVTLSFLFSCLVPPGGGKKLIIADKRFKIHCLVRPHCGEKQPCDSSFSCADWAQITLSLCLTFNSIFPPSQTLERDPC